jgi:hypothetical protein
VNASREAWLKEIDECETSNLDQCKNEEESEGLELNDEVLFKRFCFLVEFYGNVLMTGCFTWRLISTDLYLRPGQIECFQELIKITNLPVNEDKSYSEKDELTANLELIFVYTKSQHSVNFYFLKMQN